MAPSGYGTSLCTLLFGLVVVLGGTGCSARSSPIDTAPVPTSSDWAAVASLSTGTPLRLDLVSIGQVEGRLEHVTDDEVAVSVGTVVRTIPRSDVRQIVTTRRRTAEKAWRGAVIGGVAGAALGLLAETNRAAWSGLLAAGWGAVGALIGASDGFFDRAEVVVYTAVTPIPPFETGRAQLLIPDP